MQLSRSNENFDCFAILSAELTSVSHKAALVLKRGCENDMNLLRLTIFMILSILSILQYCCKNEINQESLSQVFMIIPYISITNA